MEITIVTKSVYGNILQYIENDEIASIVTGLTGKKTVDDTDLLNLEKLGNIIIKK